MKNKPFRCILPGCNRSFSKKSSLNVHMLAHADKGLLIAKKKNHIDFGANAPHITYSFSVPTIADGIRHGTESIVEHFEKIANDDDASNEPLKKHFGIERKTK